MFYMVLDFSYSLFLFILFYSMLANNKCEPNFMV
jgi:hypothetical protein